MLRKAPFLVVMGLVGLVGNGLVAQQSFDLRFKPQLGTFVQKQYETSGTMTFVGIPTLGGDSVVAPLRGRAGNITRVTDLLDGGAVVLAWVDSARLEYQIPGQQWRAYVEETDQIFLGRALVDPRFVISPIAEDGQANNRDFVMGALGELQAALPGAVAAQGDTWDSPSVHHVVVEVPGDYPSLVTATLRASGRGTLDSIVVLQADTLAYVTLRGSFTPTTVDGVHPGVGTPTAAEVWGAFVTSYVWSSGWQAWVSGAVTTRINVRVEADQTAGVGDARVHAAVTTRFRVRP